MAYDIDRAASVFKALAHASRVRIVKELLEGEKCVLEINDIVSISQPNISQHLNILKHAGLVDFRQKGNLRCYYLINRDMVGTLLDSVS